MTATRGVQILRDRRSGVFVLQPEGTFTGYGAYVGVYPYRELPSASTPREIGDCVIELLARSGPTGFPVRDIANYRAQARDGESERIAASHRLELSSNSTGKLAKRFTRASVRQISGDESWLVTSYQYSPASRLDHAAGPDVRVPYASGAIALGRAVALAAGSTATGGDPPPNPSLQRTPPG